MVSYDSYMTASIVISNVSPYHTTVHSNVMVLA